MSQIEQDFRTYLSKHPEIETCYDHGLINRRSLARHLIRNGIAKGNQMEATIAMLRRFSFKKKLQIEEKWFKNIRVNIKDKIIVLDFEKEKELVQQLQKLIGNTNYDKGDTLKIVVGSASVKLFIDEKNEEQVKSFLGGFKIKNKEKDISELSLMFPESSQKALGIISTVTKEFVLHNIVIRELLTATPELLVYVRENDVVKAYEIIKRLHQ